jgi:hypothetical protein
MLGANNQTNRSANFLLDVIANRSKKNERVNENAKPKAYLEF